jgi:hypothetical protein
MTIQPGEHASVLTGRVRDQSHLMGIFAAVAALGPELVSAYPVSSTSTDLESVI